MPRTRVMVEGEARSTEEGSRKEISVGNGIAENLCRLWPLTEQPRTGSKLPPLLLSILAAVVGVGAAVVGVVVVAGGFVACAGETVRLRGRPWWSFPRLAVYTTGENWSKGAE